MNEFMVIGPMRRALRLLATSCACAWSIGAFAQIYVGPMADATTPVVLSNHPSDATPVLLIHASAPPVLVAGPTAPLAGAQAPAVSSIVRRPSLNTDRLIPRIAREHSVPEALVRAVVAVESGFNPQARSHKGAMGLMQLMPETARRFGVVDPYSEEQNLRGGTAYLRWLLDAFSGDVSLALAAYNAGEGAVMRAGGRIPNFPETRAYVPKVMAYLRRYADVHAPSISR